MAWIDRKVRQNNDIGSMARILLAGLLALSVSIHGNAQRDDSTEPRDLSAPSRQAAFLGGVMPMSQALGLTGAGIDVLVWENSIPMLSHDAFNEADIQVLYFVDDTPGDHPTAVVGAMVGQGDCRIHPVAPEATIYFLENSGGIGSNVTRLEQWQGLLEDGVGEVTNWSFLAGGHEQKRAISAITHEHREHLLVLGAGNTAMEFFATVSNDQKNAVSVGSIKQNFEISVGNSGLGPSDEGRIKPDLVDFGSSLQLPNVNAYGEPAILSEQGSSFACAIVTGKVALIQEAAVTAFGHTLDGDLVKSLMVLTAQDLGPVGPDFEFGFGRVQIDESVEFVKQVEAGCPRVGMHIGTLIPGQRDTIDVAYSGEHPFQACLTWMDPDQGNNWHVVVNDLDVSLIDENGAVALPWAFPHVDVFLNHRDSLELHESAPAVKAVNTMDNVELIETSSSSATQHRLVVHHQGISPQTYALTWKEEPPQPWSLPATKHEVMSCDPGTENITVFNQHGGAFESPCGQSLAPGAYVAQSEDPTGCHALETFDVVCGNCPGDVDGDQFRSSADLVLMLSWHENIDVYCNSECTSFNLVGSNPVVTLEDFLAFLGVFGTPCP